VRTVAILALGLLSCVPNGAAAASPQVDVPPPVPSATISRHAAGQATVRAVRLPTPLRIDGRLDEQVFSEVPPISDFTQNDPNEGAPASEKAEVWVFFDEDNFYVVGRCWVSRPELLVANEMRRDNVNIVQNDQFAWSIDTFRDRRNALLFEVSASGGRIDAQVTNERQIDLDWNPIWDVKTGRFPGGFVVEAAIPFKSLRYAPVRRRFGDSKRVATTWPRTNTRTSRRFRRRSEVTPLMFASALLQYSSSASTFAMNIRFRWEYSPGSELFVVYNDQRDTLVAGYPGLLNRAVVVKVNRVLRS
jgi:hypothetical protein